ncbi:MAG: peptidoglycan-binding protein [Cyanobacteria bacterium J06638_20]
MSAVPQSGIALIKEFEGLHLEAYPDPLTQAEPYTIGWGSTRRKNGSPFYLGERITRAEADDLLFWQVEQYFLPALSRIPRWSTFTESQAGAILSFAYNLGAGFFGSSGFQTITRVLEEADWANLEYALTLYRNPGSNVEEGLLRRRVSEAAVFLSATPDFALSTAGQDYLAVSARTYWQNPQLSDQAMLYLAAIAQKPAPPTVIPPKTDRVLQLTDPPLNGEDVREVQEALFKAGAPLTIDGVFGPMTQQAVEWFQRLNNLAVDGIVNDRTRSFLFQRSLHLTTPYMRGEDVRTVQASLHQRCFDVDVDGVFGPGTQATVEAFQRQAGLLMDGIVGSRTRRILNTRTLYLKFPNLWGDDVTWLQRTLTRSGLSLTVDGIYGPGTEWSVKQFQARHYLDADGVVGAQTWVKLGL